MTRTWLKKVGGALAAVMLGAPALDGGARPVLAQDREPAVKVGEQAPDVELALLDGSRMRLSAVKGEKATLLYFMVAGCPGGYVDSSTFAKDWFERLKSYEPEGLRVIIVNVGDDRATAARFLRENGIEALVALDGDRSAPRAEGPVATALHGRGFAPYLMLLAPDRTVLFSQRGFRTAGLFRAIEQALGIRPRTIRARQVLVALEGGGALALDARTAEVRRRYDTGPDAFGAAFAPDGKRAFVTDKKTGTLAEVDLASDRILRTVALGAGAQQPAVSRDGRIYVPLSGESAIAVVDARGDRLALLRKIETGPGTKPHIVSLSPDGKTLYATVQGTDPKLVAIAIAEGQESAIREVRHDLVPRVVFATDEGAWFTAHHSTGVHFVRTSDGAVSTPFVDGNGAFSEPRKQVEGVAASADGRLIAITHEGRRTLVVLRRAGEGASGELERLMDVTLPANPYWVSFDPSGEAVYVSIPGAGLVQAYEIHAHTREPLWSATVGGKPKRMDVCE